MGERKYRSSSKTHSKHPRKMAAPGSSALSHLLQSTTIEGSRAAMVRCPPATLQRFRTLNSAEYMILFTPVVPHPQNTELSLNMDPFEPLGRSLSRRHSRIRHVPYVANHGMTQTHVDFLRAAGAVVVVVCTTDNIPSASYGYTDQTKFARDITRQVEADKALINVPQVLLLITNGTNSHVHLEGAHEFPAIITCSDYRPATLEDAARVMFGA